MVKQVKILYCKSRLVQSKVVGRYTISTFKAVKGSAPSDKSIFPDQLRRYKSCAEFRQGEGVAFKYLDLLEGCKLLKLCRQPGFEVSGKVMPRIDGEVSIPGKIKILSKSNQVSKSWINRKCGLSGQHLEAALMEIRCAAILKLITIVKRLPPFAMQIAKYTVLESFTVPDKILEVDMICERADQDLDSWLQNSSQLDPACFARILDGIFVQVVLGLFLFQKHAGFVHNDLHTKNIMLVDRLGTGNMRIVVNGTSYVFPEEIPLVKFIDFGQSFVYNPVRSVDVKGVFWSPLVANNNCWDLMRLAITLVKKSDTASHPYGEELRVELFEVLYTANRTETWWKSLNLNVEWFSFPIQCKTPLQLIKQSAVVKKFESRELASHHNTFIELPDDEWPVDLARFNDRELRPQSNAYMPLRAFYWVANGNKHRISRALHTAKNVVLLQLRQKLDTVFVSAGKHAGPLMCYGNLCDENTKKRMVYQALIIYQRAVIFYLITFARCEETIDIGDGANVEMMLNRGFADRSRKVREAMDAFINITYGMEMRYCLWAACGGTSEFFETWTGLPAGSRHFNRQTDIPVIRAELLSLYDETRKERKFKAPLEFASLREVHDARLEWLLDAFEWSSEMTFYSLSVEDALNVLRRNSY
jgi:hypothetical protein